MVLSVFASLGQSAPGKLAEGFWEETKELPQTYVSAKLKVISMYEGDGFYLKHDIPLGDNEDRCLMLWVKGDLQILVMLWKIELGRTGYSRGKMNGK